jgi:putative restriction endonuclease
MFTVEQFEIGLNIVWPRLHPAQRLLLECQYNASNRTITPKQLANLVGYKSNGAVNLHYAKIGRYISEALNELPEKWEDRDGYKWFKVLSTAEPNGPGSWLWKMRPEFAVALEKLGLVTQTERLIPEEIDEKVYPEGAVRSINVNAYERSTEARNRCISCYGPKCDICKFDFGIVYGEKLAGYIHVHHLRPLSEIKGEYTVDPIKDLRPVCPNCHAVIHSRKPPYSVEEVQLMIENMKVNAV